MEALAAESRRSRISQIGRAFSNEELLDDVGRGVSNIQAEARRGIKARVGVEDRDRSAEDAA
jgi:hypothetical protein